MVCPRTERYAGRGCGADVGVAGRTELARAGMSMAIGAAVLGARNAMHGRRVEVGGHGGSVNDDSNAGRVQERRARDDARK